MSISIIFYNTNIIFIFIFTSVTVGKTFYLRSVVDEYEDLGGEKIGDSIKYLNAYFAPEEPASKNTEIDKTTTLSIVVGIAVFGMTSIAIFYLLMKKNIIS